MSEKVYNFKMNKKKINRYSIYSWSILLLLISSESFFLVMQYDLFSEAIDAFFGADNTFIMFLDKYPLTISFWTCCSLLLVLVVLLFKNDKEIRHASIDFVIELSTYEDEALAKYVKDNLKKSTREYKIIEYVYLKRKLNEQKDSPEQALPRSYETTTDHAIDESDSEMEGGELVDILLKEEKGGKL